MSSNVFFNLQKNLIIACNKFKILCKHFYYPSATM